jgi:DNA-binding LacI/PurR family transcriptional regulator
MTTIRKVAKKAGVSPATVSRVLNGTNAVAPELRDRVLDAVNQYGYAPTSGRRSETSIAIVYTGQFSVNSPYDCACLHGIVTGMLDSDYDLRIVYLNRDKTPSETYSQFFFRKGVRGAILRSTCADRDVVRQIADDDFPTVVLGDHFDHPNLVFAYNQSRTASVEGVEHLLALGHRRIAFASNDVDDGDHLDRLDAYRSVLQTHGLHDPQLEFHVPAHRSDGAQLIRKILSLTAPPTALFIADPLTADGVIHETHRMGVRIPDELSIVGFDDGDSRFAVYPTMTAVCQDAERLGRLTLELLWQRLATPPAERESVPARRQSVGSAWLEINHTTGWAPRRPVRILPNGSRMEPANS